MIGLYEYNVCHFSALSNSCIFGVELLFGASSEFRMCAAHQTDSNTGSGILVYPPYQLELLYGVKPLLPF